MIPLTPSQTPRNARACRPVFCAQVAALALSVSMLTGWADSVTNLWPSQIEGQARIEFHSADIWRGRTLANAPIFTPGATLELTKDIWADAEAAVSLGRDRDRTDAGDISSLHLSLWRRFHCDDTLFDAGISGYAHPEDSQIKDAVEVYLESHWLWQQIVASFAVFHAVDEEFTYGYGAVQYWHEITPVLDVNAGLRIGASSDNFSSLGYGGWHDILVNSSASYTGLSMFDIVVAIAYAESLDRDVLQGQAVNWYGSMHISRPF